VAPAIGSVAPVASWSWTLAGADGAPLEASPAGAVPGGDQAPQQPAAGFPVQADAETWMGESWRALLAAGVEQAWLRQGDAPVYGPIALRPPA